MGMLKEKGFGSFIFLLITLEKFTLIISHFTCIYSFKKNVLCICIVPVTVLGLVI